MRFNFVREGRRFFFITLVVKGRRCLLSRRVRDEIVELLPAGRRVKDHWATSHKRQLKAIRRYIKMNPARAWWKESHRDMFIRRGGLRHEMPDPAFPWTAFGNLTLLANPFLYQVRLTTKKTLPELEVEIAAAIEKARNGMVPVSGFISPGEKEFFRRLLKEPSTRWIKMLPYVLAPRYDPSVEDSRHLAEGRVLILSAFPTSVPSSPISRSNCLAMNDRIAELCKRAGELGARRGQGFGGTPPNPRGVALNPRVVTPSPSGVLMSNTARGPLPVSAFPGARGGTPKPCPLEAEPIARALRP